jgi:hypothetical protein
MIDEKVVGVYASVGPLPPAEQAEWYRRVATDWGINGFELPLLAGQPLAPEVAEELGAMSSTIVVTMVTQLAIVGQQDTAYGLSAAAESSRGAAVLDLQSAIQQCVSLSRAGVVARAVVVHVGRRSVDTISHAVAFYRSLVELKTTLAAVLPNTVLSVEITDNRPDDHPIPFPAAKKAPLEMDQVLQTVAAVNRDVKQGRDVSMVANLGRFIVNGDDPIKALEKLLAAEVPFEGVIMSGAGASKNGFIDSHNSHLDPGCKFTAADGQRCADLLNASSQKSFIGTKCSVATGKGEIATAEVLGAQAELLNSIVS